MSDEFNENEARLFIETKVSTIHRKLVLEALEMQDPAAVADIGLLMAGEKSQTGFIIPTGITPKEGRFWAAVLDEVYEFFCTNNAAYKRERNQGAGLFESAVTIIATALSAKLSIGLGLTTGVVSVAVISVLKIGRNAWCDIRKAQAKSPS